MLKEVTNEHGVTYHEVWDEGELKGRIYETFHPTILYKAYVNPAVLSKRVMTLQEGEDFILSPEDHKLVEDLVFKGENVLEDYPCGLCG